MIESIKNIDLKPFNTFGFSAKAKEFITCTHIDQITEALNYLKQNPQPYLILGGGSNILFSKDFNGLIIHPQLNNISLLKENNNEVWLEVGAGIEWDKLVEYSVDKNWGGLENLSHIPGHVGASPVQNIGAYGVEAKDCINTVKGIFIDSGEAFELSNSACQFDYRQSIFKSQLKHKTIITSVVFKLNKQPKLNLSYGPVKELIEANGEHSLKAVRQTIIDIRKSKLPEPEEFGNAGSFFKNPIISQPAFNTLQNKFPKVPHYPIDENNIKVPAGWLIEQTGWKGKNIGQAGVHSKQALVLINKGKATGADVIHLANTIIDAVKDQFNICISPEVNII